MTKALLKEIKLRAAAKEIQEPVDTIYFGGGTPSLLAIQDLTALVEAIHHYWSVSPSSEITLEANPEDIQIATCGNWLKAGINRLSLGIQSIYDDELNWMNRNHSAESSIHAVSTIKEAGFTNFSIDLIYGGPLLTEERWSKTVEWVVGEEIPHLSCYALTVEPKTPLQNQIRTKRKTAPDLEQTARQFEFLQQVAHQNGWEHYEISNWAKPGFRSRHNSSYWKRTPYIGIGPSAHSFDGKSRQWNVADNNAYIKSIQQEHVPTEREVLSRVQQINETIMIRLRVLEGCDLQEIRHEFGESVYATLLSAAEKHINAGTLMIQHEHLVLTQKGKLLADGIAADLFFEED